MATPGPHRATRLSFLLDDAVLTADTVLGPRHHRHRQRGRQPGDYLESLRRLRGLGRRDGPAGPRPRSRRPRGRQRHVPGAPRGDGLDQVRDALRVLGEDATARQIVEHVYTDVDEKLWDGGRMESTKAQLDYLPGSYARRVIQAPRDRQC